MMTRRRSIDDAVSVSENLLIFRSTRGKFDWSIPEAIAAKKGRGRRKRKPAFEVSSGDEEEAQKPKAKKPSTKTIARDAGEKEA